MLTPLADPESRQNRSTQMPKKAPTEQKHTPKGPDTS